MTMPYLEFEGYLTLTYVGQPFDGVEYFTKGAFSQRIEVGEWAEETLFISSPATTALVCCHFVRHRFTEDIAISDFIRAAQEFPPESFVTAENVAMLLKGDLEIAPTKEGEQIAPRFLDRGCSWNLFPIVGAKGRTIVGGGYTTDERWRLSRRLMKSYAGEGSELIKKGDCLIRRVEKTPDSL